MFMAVTEVLSMVGVGEMPSLVGLEDDEFMGCIWIRVEERRKVEIGNWRSLRFSMEFGVWVTQFG